MDKSEYRHAAYDMIYLAACAVNNRNPNIEAVKNMDIDAVFNISEAHNLTAAVSYGLLSAGINDSRFNEAREKAIRKNILLDADRARIFRRMDEEGIWHMPLKGALLKDWYPKLGMRQMSDNDILFDPSSRETVKRIMEELGFSCEHYGTGCNDAYYHNPVSNFEMHIALFTAASSTTLKNYYSDIKKKLIPDKDNRSLLHFTPEDFYLYLLSHEYKHFSSGGTGVRSLLDTYVFLRRYGNDIDWSYIECEAEKLGLKQFEINNRVLALKLFTLKKLTQENKKALDYYVMSGTYGTIANKARNTVNNKLENNSPIKKAEYLFRRLFPPMEHYKVWFPWAYRHKLLLPAAWLLRIIRAGTSRRVLTSGELKTLRHK